MKRAGWFMRLWRRITHCPSVDHPSIRDELMRSDPDFARVRDVQHAALGAIAAKQAADGLAIRRERQFWQRAMHRD